MKANKNKPVNYAKLHRLLKNRIGKLQKKARNSHAKTLELQEQLSKARSQLHQLVMNMIDDPVGFEKSIDQILKSYES